LDELGVPQQELIESVRSELNTNSQKESVDSFSNGSTSSDCVFTGQEPHKWKMRSRHTHPGERPFKSDTDNAHLSEQVSFAGESSDQRENKLYNCEFCTESFSSKRRLLRHHKDSYREKSIQSKRWQEPECPVELLWKEM